MWRQAQATGIMALEPIVGNGWIKDQTGKLAIDWDSQENMTKIRSRVDLVLKGCSCKGGCTTNRCGCRKKGVPCGVGCGCTNCGNQEDQCKNEQAKDMALYQRDLSTEESASSSEESDTEHDDTESYVNKVMDEVFGQWDNQTDNESSR